jgi:hypothetical protein
LSLAKNTKNKERFDMPAMMKKVLMIFMVVFCSVSLCLASQGDGNRNGDQDHDRLQDGSCLDNIEKGNPLDLTLAAQSNRGQGKGQGDRQRDRDGSCLL